MHLNVCQDYIMSLFPGCYSRQKPLTETNQTYIEIKCNVFLFNNYEKIVFNIKSYFIIGEKLHPTRRMRHQAAMTS